MDQLGLRFDGVGRQEGTKERRKRVEERGSEENRGER